MTTHMKLADLKGTYTRLNAALERAEAIRPALTPESAEALDTLQGNVKDLREGVDELMMTVPDGWGVNEIPMEAEEQRHVDASVAAFTRLSETLEAWLEEWGA